MKTKYKKLAGILVLAMGSPAMVSANTEVLYDTLSLSNPYDNFHSISQGQWAAGLFSTGDKCPLGCKLGDITLSLSVSGLAGNIPTDSSSFSLSVYSDNGGQLGNPLAGTINNPTDPYIIGSGWNDYVFQTDSVGIALADNTSYWVKLTSSYPSIDNFISWEWDYYSGVSQRSYQAGGFGILGDSNSFLMKIEAEAGPELSAVPLPGAIWLMGSALVGLAIQGGRRRAV